MEYAKLTISIIAILVNLGLTVWIVKVIQRQLTDKRTLKNHFITEVIEIRSIYRDKLSDLYAGKSYAKSLISWFKLMNIKINDLMLLINKIYDIDIGILKPYRSELRLLITEMKEFTEGYEFDKPIKFSSHSKQQILKFQDRHNNIFNNLIVQINDAK